MSVTLWLDTESEETLELGATLAVYAAFSEMARTVGQGWYDQYPDLSGVLTQCELQEDADPQWLADASGQASKVLQQYGERLSRASREILTILSKPEEFKESEESDTFAEDDPDAFADMMAETLYGLFGDKALKYFEIASEDDKIESLGSYLANLVEGWNALDHPRGPGGRFIPRGSGEAVSAAKTAIGKVLKGEKTPATAEKVMQHLSILTVKQLKSLHKEHGVAVPGHLREQLVGAIKARLPGGTGKKPKKDAGTKKPKKDEKEPAKPPTPEPEKSKEDTPTPESGKHPRAPQPDYSGTDTLGRIWENGKLTGKTEPVKIASTAPFELNPTRKFNAKDFVGDVPDISAEELQDLNNANALYPNNRPVLSIPFISYKVAGRNPALFDRLHKKGILTPDGSGGYEFSERGKMALAVHHYGVQDLQGDPSTQKQIVQLTNLYALADEPTRKKMLDHFGLTRKDEYYDGADFLQDLKNAANAHHNPPMAQRLRNAKDLHESVAKLSHLQSNTTQRIQELQHQLTRFNRQLAERKKAGRTAPLDIYQIEGAIENLDRQLAYSKSRNKKQLREDVEFLRSMKDQADKVIEEKISLQKKREASGTEHHDKVSEHLRQRVKDPAPIRVGHSPDVPEAAKKRMDRAVELLGGALQKLSKGTPSFVTYLNSESKRAHHTFDGKINFHDSKHNSETVAIHEIMHGIEQKDPEIAQAVQDFRKHRVGDEKPTNLREKFGGYDEGEQGYKDRFDLAFDREAAAYYTGKIYNETSTEILTMGVQKLYEDPSGFCARDPEFAAFIIGILDGSMRNKPIPEE